MICLSINFFVFFLNPDMVGFITHYICKIKTEPKI